MNHGPLVFLGALVAMAASWFGLVMGPLLQLEKAQPVDAVNTGDPYPQMRPGLAAQGAEVYRSLGCVSCHSQQVCSKEFNSDIARGWGSRRSVAQDYLYDRPVLLGSQRVGPDLSNIGARSPGADWLMLHLYDARTVLPKDARSVMPPNRFLFEMRKITGQPSPDALKLTGDLAPPTGVEVMPTAKARQLVAYLLSLRSDAILFETPAPKAPTAEAPVAATNSPAK